MMKAKLASSFIGASSVFHLLIQNGIHYFHEENMKSYNFQLHRLWWQWKGDQPSAKVVAFMNKTYPPDWTYADFAAQFRAEFYGN
jgi:hypothetical protein